MNRPRRPAPVLSYLVLATCCIALLVSTATTRAAEPAPPAESELVDYKTGPFRDPIAKLQEKMDNGEVELSYDKKWGYLPDILERLNIPHESQGLVFSKTSLQINDITPRTPRAIYFNDDTYVGWVKNAWVIEISTTDPYKGAIFYSLDQEQDEKPEFIRQTGNCLVCHDSSRTQRIPGHLVRSVYPSKNGLPHYGAGTYLTDHRSPFEKRWGGWYVTGTHGKQRHMGNVLVASKHEPENLDREAGANITDLKQIKHRLDLDSYLTPHSDIVALMVLEHQTQMHNFISKANHQCRLALRDEQVLQEMLREDNPSGETPKRSESIQRRIDNAARRMLEYMLYVGEAPLTDTIAGTADFTKTFAQTGPRDSQGRSLRDFDLNTRIFKYPCSYLIYSDAFQSLPQPVRASFFRQLDEVLTGKNDDEKYAHLSKADRTAIREILTETLAEEYKLSQK